MKNLHPGLTQSKATNEPQFHRVANGAGQRSLVAFGCGEEVMDEDDRETFEANAVHADREGEDEASNPFESLARQIKVRKLVRALKSAAELIAPQHRPWQLADIAASFTPGNWTALEVLAHVKPSSETTRAAVVEELRGEL